MISCSIDINMSIEFRNSAPHNLRRFEAIPVVTGRSLVSEVNIPNLLEELRIRQQLNDSSINATHHLFLWATSQGQTINQLISRLEIIESSFTNKAIESRDTGDSNLYNFQNQLVFCAAQVKRLLQEMIQPVNVVFLILDSLEIHEAARKYIRDFINEAFCNDPDLCINKIYNLLREEAKQIRSNANTTNNVKLLKESAWLNMLADTIEQDFLQHQKTEGRNPPHYL